jgi:dienelactone hydrolase
MIPLFCQWIDRVAIRHAAARMPKPDGRDLRLEEVRRLLQNFDLSPPGTKPAAVQFDSPAKFGFASPRPSAHTANNVVYGRLYRCGDHWRQKPVVLLLHGWNDALNHYLYFPQHARRLNRHGINAVTLQLPWQFDRRPRELGAWGNFLSADVLHTVEATLQALAEIRSLLDWLAGRGCPFIGLWGVSLGAWLAGLTLCHDSRIGCAVLTAPIPRLDRLIEEAAFCETIRSALQGRRVDLHTLNLVSNRPLIAAENILLVEAEHDSFVARDNVEELWRAWDKPQIWRCRQGHISVLWVPGLPGRVVRWIAARAGGQTAK